MSRRERCALFAALVCLLLSVGCSSTVEKGGISKYGLGYQLQIAETPRVNRIHVLRLDLPASRARLSAVVPPDPDGDGPAESSLTNPLKLAAKSSVIAFVNANPWRGMIDQNTGEEDRNWRENQPVDIIGMAISDGGTRSWPEANSVSVRVDPEQGILIGEDTSETFAVEGVAGFKQILTDGVIESGLDERLAPRTAIGIDNGSKTLWLVVVDGRQAGFSEGVSCAELAGIMLDLGCRNAVNMDGGGSSIMAVRDTDGELKVVNSPSDRDGDKARIRPVPIILAIERK